MKEEGMTFCCVCVCWKHTKKGRDDDVPRQKSATTIKQATVTTHHRAIVVIGVLDGRTDAMLGLNAVTRQQPNNNFCVYEKAHAPKIIRCKRASQTFFSLG